MPCAAHHSSDGILLILIAAATDAEANDLALSVAGDSLALFHPAYAFASAGSQLVC